MHRIKFFITEAVRKSYGHVTVIGNSIQSGACASYNEN